MCQNTDALLRSILFHVLIAKGDATQIQYAIKAMCSKDLVAAVEKEFHEMEKAKEQE